MKNSLDAEVLRAKVDYEVGGIGISHGKTICALKYKVRVNVSGSGAMVIVGAWVKSNCFFLGVDDVDFSSPDEKFSNGG